MVKGYVVLCVLDPNQRAAGPGTQARKGVSNGGISYHHVARRKGGNRNGGLNARARLMDVHVLKRAKPHLDRRTRSESSNDGATTAGRPYNRRATSGEIA
jgi:hypothetical protein